MYKSCGEKDGKSSIKGKAIPLTGMSPLWYNGFTSKRVYFFVQIPAGSLPGERKLRRKARPCQWGTGFLKNKPFFLFEGGKLVRIYRRCRAMRVKITLACTECKQRNYNTMKNKKNDPDRLEMNKYCRFCKKHTVHKESK